MNGRWMLLSSACLAALTTLVFSIAGCGGGAKVDPNSVASSESDFDAGKSLAASGDYSGALTKLENAIKKGGLNPDIYGEALLWRAQCYAMTGKMDEALSDIKASEQSGPSEALVELTKGIVLEKQGKASESKAAFAKAKKLDPNLKIPK